MKIEWNKKYTTISAYILLILLVVVVAVFLLLRWTSFGTLFTKVLSAVKPLLYAGIIAYILWPMLRFFETRLLHRLEKKKTRKRLVRALSLILTYLVFLAILALFIGALIPQITDSVLTLRNKFSGYIASVQTWLDTAADKFHLSEYPFFNEISEKLSGLTTEALQWIYDNISTIFTEVTSYAGTFAMEIKNILLGIIFAIYFLLFKENLFAQTKKFLLAIMPQRHYDAFSHYIGIADRTFGGFFTGKILDSAIIGFLCLFFMSVFQMPYAPLISLIVGVTNIIPFFGPFIGAIPSAFIIFIADTRMTLWFILLILVLQQLDGNVIGPKILGDFLGMNPLWIIISITVMGGLFGFFGMFFGVPIFAVFYVIVKELAEKRLTERGLPAETAAYYTDEKYLPIAIKENKKSVSLQIPHFLKVKSKNKSQKPPKT